MPKPDANDASFNERPPSPFLQPLLPPASLAGGLAHVKAVDADFDERQFLEQARSDFTAIVEAYAKADMDSVASLVSPELLIHFQNAAAARNAAGQTAQTKVLKIKEADPTAARAEGTQTFVTVRFISDQENILRDARGTVIGGAEGKCEEVTDTWTFARDAQKPEAKWLVVETRG
jgi:predicted lipid-binding transport protein (Tim44 family)